MRNDDRFWSKVRKGDKCWEWDAAKSGDGYGTFDTTFGTTFAHRFSWTLRNGIIPKGLQIDHLCRNRGCVNHDHMELVTPKENTLRGIGPSAINARKLFCGQGHKFSGGNTIRTKDGKRRCRSCNSVWHKEYRERLALAKLKTLAPAPENTNG